ncbi:MAG TPA: 6-phosphofructokinase [Clostridia bacterium]|nr:6-phosphofructokinase [Clostridia bacterium]
MKKTIGVLTSGGDAPGMNAAVRAVVRTAKYHKLDVYGIRRGFRGLLEQDYVVLNSRSVSDILQKGGTFIKSARSPEFNSEEGVKKAAGIINDLALDALIVIGGDGTIRGAAELAKQGVKVIVLPGSIDNDLGYTDYTIGFDTAITTVMNAMSNLRDTSSSHGRVFVVQVMGRECGDIALHAGIVSGAEEVIVPEMPFDMEEVTANIRKAMARGKSHYIILLAEGAADPFTFTEEIQKLSGINTRLNIIGYLQRGGSPSSFDRMLATRLGVHAVELFLEGKHGIAVGIRGNELVHENLTKAIEARDSLDKDLYEMAKILAV